MNGIIAKLRADRSTIIFGTWILIFLGSFSICHFVGPFITGIHNKAIEDSAIVISFLCVVPSYFVMLLNTDFGRLPEKRKRFWWSMVMYVIILPAGFYFIKFM